MDEDGIAVARRCYQAYVDGDRTAIEALIGEEFSFTSPVDNALDRKTYFERCWPNHRNLAGFRFVHLVADADRVFVTYEARTATGEAFRNTEILTIRDGRLVAAEVYFGWPMPHPAPSSGFIDR
ncbi:nuclear transport factor 2 family protein [Methylobacterium brachythecii]|uniref:Ketosteroid isomerase-like protein n=1 Tax=Methylobacterium brachythecii TaxID=1176177 RepID=A0A7W6AK22_9HYPH|nr:nuclear transport factor 2 family protein [Methylobacterium brachythecii]MBB3904868.1 ketosteroid isomerase-like protein [Methylobacterium brachythecii]GLS46655.1 hypothetical protein GCM10007884_46490 [Methylobacterium brachythecii]